MTVYVGPFRERIEKEKGGNGPLKSTDSREYNPGRKMMQSFGSIRGNTSFKVRQGREEFRHWERGEEERLAQEEREIPFDSMDLIFPPHSTWSPASFISDLESAEM
jgi:hypothetical protein